MSHEARRIDIYDTTLRDGSQGEGVNFSLQDKLLITQKLDELGIDYIEGGYPLSNPKDAEYFQRVREISLKHAKVAAFGMTRRKGLRPEDDIGMRGPPRRQDAGGHASSARRGTCTSTRCSASTKPKTWP